MTEPAGSSDGIGRRLRSGFKWTGAELALRLGVRLAALAVLARLLRPAEFGVFAASMTAWELLRPLSTLCMEQAMVQRETLTDRDVGVACGIATTTCLIATLTLIFGADAVGVVYEDPFISEVVFVLAFSFPLHCASMLSLSALRRKLAFRPLSLIALFASVSGAVASVASAMSGLGVWSLVVGHYTEALLPGVLALHVMKDQLRWPRLGGAWKPLGRFGVGQTLALFLNYWALHGDYVVVGRYLGSRPLGFYSRAYQLMSVAPNLFGALHATVLFPGLSRLQSDAKRTEATFRDGIDIIATVSIPASAFAIIAAPELVRVVLGPGWEQVVQPFQILAAGIYLRTAYRLMASVILAQGHVFRLAVCQGVYAALVVGGSLYALRWGIVGVAAATLFALIVFYGLLALVAMRVAKLRAWTFIRAHLHSAVLLAVVLVVGLGVRQFVAVDLQAPLAFVGIAATAVVLTLLALTRVLGERLWGPLLYDLGRQAYLKYVRRSASPGP